jgi:hypothetical protein
MKKPDNKGAQVMGILKFGTFPSVASATRAAIEFGLNAHGFQGNPIWLRRAAHPRRRIARAVVLRSGPCLG